MLTAADLWAGYRKRVVLREITVRYGPGLHVLLGPNGAGKTTLFRALAGVLPPIRGQVLISGRDPHAESAAKALIGVGAHRAALAPRLSVADNLRYWARVMALPPGQRERRVNDVIDIVGLADISGREAGTLSRGQTQRVGLAKALLPDPPVLLLDEPTAGVDPGIAIGLREELKSLAGSGRTVVISTHDLNEACELADDVTVLHDGRIAGRGEPSTLREQLVGDGYRVRLRGRGDLTGQLARLGYRGEASAGAVIVGVAGEEAVEKLVAELVLAGVAISEVTPVGNALEDVYLHLQSEGARRATG